MSFDSIDNKTQFSGVGWGEKIRQVTLNTWKWENSHLLTKVGKKLLFRTRCRLSIQGDSEVDKIPHGKKQCTCTNVFTESIVSILQWLSMRKKVIISLRARKMKSNWSETTPESRLHTPRKSRQVTRTPKSHKSSGIHQGWFQSQESPEKSWKSRKVTDLSDIVYRRNLFTDSFHQLGGW